MGIGLRCGEGCHPTNFISPLISQLKEKAHEAKFGVFRGDRSVFCSGGFVACAEHGVCRYMEAEPGEVEVTYKFEGEGADGTAFSYGFTSKYDGKDSEITGTGMPFGADHIAIKQVNSHMLSAAMKKGDKAAGTSSATVSHDGKTLTLTSKGTDANGKPMKTVAVYDKQ
jgi:hypothetical protein